MTMAKMAALPPAAGSGENRVPRPPRRGGMAGDRDPDDMTTPEPVPGFAAETWVSSFSKVAKVRTLASKSSSSA